MVNNNGKSGHPCLVPDFRGNAFSFSLFRMMFPMDLSYRALLCLSRLPVCPLSGEVLS